MISQGQLTIGEDLDVEIDGLRRRRSAAYDNAATVTFVLTNSDGSTVTSGTCSYVPGSNGRYIAAGGIAYTTSLTLDALYWLVITVVGSDSRRGRRRIPYYAKDHGSR